jgi:insulysin
MKLAIVGKESTEELEKWAREKFAKVPIRSEGSPAVGEEGVRVVFDSSPMGEKQMGVSCRPSYSRLWACKGAELTATR